MWIKDMNGDLVNMAHCAVVHSAGPGGCRVFGSGDNGGVFELPMSADELFDMLKAEAGVASRQALALEKLARCVSNDGTCLDVITHPER